MNDDQMSDAIDRLTNRAFTAEKSLSSIRQRLARAQREARQIEQAYHRDDTRFRLAPLYAYALEDVGLFAGIPEEQTWLPQAHAPSTPTGDLPDLVAQDQLDNPRGHPCRDCGRFYDAHRADRIDVCGGWR